MEIRTKFKLYQRIFIVIKDDDNIWKSYPFIITGIRYFEHNIIYNNEFDFDVLEQNCFATKEQAQKECDKRNEK